MKKDEMNRLVRLQLDKQLNSVKSALLLHRPMYGWIQTIRKALGMTSAQFAKRVGVAQSRASAIESAEISDSLTLKTLKDSAEALNCKFIYFIVPENTLSDIVTDKAKQVVQEKNKHVIHSMGLENQSLTEQDANDFLSMQMQDLLLNHTNKIWEQ